MPPFRTTWVAEINESANERPWYAWVSDKLTVPGDGPDDVNTKLLVSLIVVLATVGSAVWGTIFYCLGNTVPALMLLLMVLTYMFGGVHLLVTKRPHVAINCVVYTILVGSLSLQVLHGGAPDAAGGVLCPAFLAPLVAATLGSDLRKGTWLVVVISVVSLALTVLEQAIGGEHLTPIRYTLPEPYHSIFLWLHINAVGAVSYCLTVLTIRQLKGSRRDVYESKVWLECLNGTLTQQRQKLEVQQRLAHNLICNIFPKNVSKALIALFQRSAERDKDATERRFDICSRLRKRSACEYIAAIGIQGTEAAEKTSGPKHQPSGMQSMADDHAQRYSVATASQHSASEDGGSIASSSESEIVVPPAPDGFLEYFAPKLHDFAVVLFADIVGFTALASRTNPAILVRFLDQFFGAIDEFCLRQGVEKIKTIGDCYMCVAWEEDPSGRAGCAQQVMEVAHEMHCVMLNSRLDGSRLSVRAGMHAGPVISGIIGKTKFAFDIWGDTVNVASRMESTGVPRATQVTAEVYELLKGREALTPRHEVDVKGKGSMMTYVTPVFQGHSSSSVCLAKHTSCMSPSTAAHGKANHFNVVDVLSDFVNHLDA